MTSVYGCGCNTFSQLGDFADLNFDNCKSKSQQSGAHYHVMPVLLVHFTKDEVLQNLLFTWSRIVATFKRDNGVFSFISGFKGTNIPGQKGDANAGNVLKNYEVVAATDANVLFKESSSDETANMILHENSLELQSLKIDSVPSTSTVKNICGGHNDFFTVYDDLSFGRLSAQPTRKKIDSAFYMELHPIDSGISITTVSCGKEHALLLSKHGNVYSHGLGSRGQTGHGDVEEQTQPRIVEALEGVRMVAVAAGGWHSAAVSDIGDLYTWGWNESGQLGFLSTNSQKTRGTKTEDEAVGIQTEPRCVQMPEEMNVSSVACGSRHTVCLIESGRVFSCGWNAYGQLGLGHKDNQYGFQEVTSLQGSCVSIYAGQWNTVFVCSE